MDGSDVFHITKCLHPRVAALGPEQAKLICDSFLFLGRAGRIHLAAFVVMPDHWHAVWGVCRGWTLPQIMHSLMSHVGGRTAGGVATQGCAWQEGYHDTLIRSARQFVFICRYCEANPVRKQLVAQADEWAWSSATPAYAAALVRPWPWSFEHEDINQQY